MVRVFYNPLSNSKKGRENAVMIEKILPGEEFDYIDITQLDSTYKAIMSYPVSDKVVVTGGDGTLNSLANEMCKTDIQRDIYYFATGSGNDFYKDIKKSGDSGFVLLNPYIKDLPKINIKGVERVFLNGVGYGLDGHCCDEANKRKSKSGKHVSYALLALRGLLYSYKPTSVTITVDGVKRTFEKVWMVSAMNGRYFGGGIKIAPDQNRLDPDKKLCFLVVHNLSRLGSLPIFPTIFLGKHTGFKKIVEVIKGDEIKVEFDADAPLQIDGETVMAVNSYSAASCNVLKVNN